MHKKVFLSVLVVMIPVAFWVTGCASMGRSKTAMEPKVSMYLRTWPIPEASRAGDSPYWNADMIRGEYLTDIIIAFALLEKDDVSVPYIPEVKSGEFDLWEEVAKLKNKFPHLKVNVSVGGYAADGFSDMTFDPALRAKFAANICTWLEEYNLDGMDVDWEYPVGPEWGSDIKVRPQDKQNYIALLRDLRSAFDALGEKTGKRYGLSTAVPASGWFPKANDVVAASKIVDSLKLMSYDYYGGWSSTTGHNNNPYINPHDPAWGGWSTDQALNEYLWAGVQPSKIVLGVPFYGKGWQGVKQGEYEGTPGLFQPYKSLPFEQGTLSWSQITEFLKPGSGYTRHWDDMACSPYLYNGDIWISYCDPEQIKILTDYVRSNSLVGVFVWEYGHDMNAELLKVLAENSQ